MEINLGTELVFDIFNGYAVRTGLGYDLNKQLHYATKNAKSSTNRLCQTSRQPPECVEVRANFKPLLQSAS